MGCINEKIKLGNFKRLGTRLLLGFGFVLILVTVLSVVNLSSIYRINQDTEVLIEEELDLLNISSALADDMLQQLNYLQAYVLTGVEEYRETYSARMEDSHALGLRTVERTNNAQLEEAVSQQVEWGQLTTMIFNMLDTGDQNGAINLFQNRLMQSGMEITAEYNAVARQYEENITTLGEQIISSSRVSLSSNLLISISIIIVGILTAIFTTRTISRPIAKLTDQMLAIASGDLTKEIDVINRRDELGQLNQATHQMSVNMRKLLLEIQHVSQTVTEHSHSLTATTNEVSEGAEQISSTMQELSSGSETQATHASSLSTGMNEFVSTVSSAQQFGESVVGESENTRRLTVNGSDLMAKSVDQMRQIDSIVTESVDKVIQLTNQSKEISNIVSVIRDISEQTNLLALNASIEAARAGEHGRGFAVVAEEVRKLAEQVGSSIEDITKIVSVIQIDSESVKVSLEDSYEQVQQGMGNIQDTSETFRQIDDSIGHVAGSIQEITNELTTMLGVGQSLSTSVEEIASISEESAAGVEQTSASAEEVSSSMEEILTSSADLTKLANQLNGLLGQFKL